MTKTIVIDNLKAFSFFQSYYDASLDLESEDEQDRFYGSIVRYAFTGIEPDFDLPQLRMAWKLVKPNVDKSIMNALNGASGGKQKGANSRTKKRAIKTGGIAGNKDKATLASEQQKRATLAGSLSDKDIPSPNPSPYPSPTPSQRKGSTQFVDSDVYGDYLFSQEKQEQVLRPLGTQNTSADERQHGFSGNCIRCGAKGVMMTRDENGTTVHCPKCGDYHYGTEIPDELDFADEDIPF